MEAVETQVNGKATGRQTRNNGQAPAEKRPRRTRPAPVAYSSDQLKAVSFSLPHVAQKGLSFEKLPLYALFSLTSDGESLCVKKSKSEAIQPASSCLFDGAGLTVYPLVW